MAAPQELIVALRAGMALMTVANNFVNDYGAADVARPSQWALPQPFLNVGNETARPSGRNMIGKLEQDLPIAFRVMVPPPVLPQTLHDVCAIIETDFKFMMAQIDASLRAVGVMKATYLGGTWSPRLVVSCPAEIILNWSLWYRQSRTNPSAP